MKEVGQGSILCIQLIEWGLSFALNYESGKVPEVPLKLKNFLESFAFNSQRKAYKLLRGQHSVETKDSGISKQSFQRADYNIVLPSYKSILKHKPPPLSGEGVISSQLQNILRLAENKSEPFFEDNKSKIYLNTMVNDEMALKPAGQIDYNTRTITGTSKTIDIKFIKENPVLKPEVIKDIYIHRSWCPL